MNEAAAQICRQVPAMLTRRDELFPLARQVVRDSGYQYSKGHSRYTSIYLSIHLLSIYLTSLLAGMIGCNRLRLPVQQGALQVQSIYLSFHLLSIYLTSLLASMIGCNRLRLPVHQGALQVHIYLFIYSSFIYLSN